jgi:hypothetical protein
MMLTLMHARLENDVGVSRQGGSAIGGGVAANRHHAVQLGTRSKHSRRQLLDCVACSQPVTGVKVVVAGSAYCSWDCAVSVAGIIPGQYFG